MCLYVEALNLFRQDEEGRSSRDFIGFIGVYGLYLAAFAE
ncbi:hypothetical protein C4K16_2928 [Pseudomonas chlororaphis subsp. aurantiaca]|nr:hypothetical protein C4K17_2920 [Pseudomonas chlororaphis subsp. aurantiaca]AZD73288.1 hypothetical protein C4K16_2928 [Pseudomonas chlororaphis subsp. aurantiaca]